MSLKPDIDQAVVTGIRVLCLSLMMTGYVVAQGRDADPGLEQPVTIDNPIPPPEPKKTVEELDYYRKLGDKAYEDGFYKEATVFYRDCRKYSQDHLKIYLDASFKLINCYLKTDQLKAAKDILQDIKEEKLGADPNQVTLFQANIFIKEDNFSGARNCFKEILKRSKPDQPIYKTALHGLGFSSAKLQDWNEATKAYSELSELEKNAAFNFFTFQQKFLMLLDQNKPDNAAELLKNVPADISKKKQPEMQLLETLLLLKQKKLAEALKTYENIDKFGNSRVRTLLFKTAFALGMASLEANDAKTAVAAFIDASYVAPKTDDRKRTMRMLIKGYTELDEINNAVYVTKRYLNYYGNNNQADTIQVKLNYARLLNRLNKTGTALALYNTIAELTKTDMSYRLAAATEATEILIREKLYQEAIKKLEFVIANTKNADQKADSEYRVASILFLEKKYPQALGKFTEIADHYPALKEKALYQAIQVLVNLEDHTKLYDYTTSFVKEFTKSPFLADISFLQAMSLSKIANKMPDKSEKDNVLKQEKLTDARDAFTRFAQTYPQSPYAAAALLNAGNIAYSNCDYSEADKIFTDLLGKYAKSNVAPEALSKRILARYLSNKDAAAIDDALLLKKDYPAAPQTDDALFWLVSVYLQEPKDYKKADLLLTDMVKLYRKSPAIAAKALYEQAELAFKTRDYQKSLGILNNLISLYPDETVVSKALYLFGDIYSQEGGEDGFNKAITYYQKAAERRPGSRFSQACFGRIGDCYFSLYPYSGFDKKMLQKAIENYKTLLAQKDVSVMFHNQTLYKLGKAQKEIGNLPDAEKTFYELFYGNKLKMGSGSDPETLWVVKGALAMVTILLEKNTPEDARKAVRIYEKLIQNQIEPVSEFSNRVNAIKKEFRLK